ncbi:hypothetical protein Hanom_Chr06g00545081 [Helianthus anomalus]
MSKTTKNGMFTLCTLLVLATCSPFAPSTFDYLYQSNGLAYLKHNNLKIVLLMMTF